MVKNAGMERTDVGLMSAECKRKCRTEKVPHGPHIRLQPARSLLSPAVAEGSPFRQRMHALPVWRYGRTMLRKAAESSAAQVKTTHRMIRDVELRQAMAFLRGLHRPSVRDLRGLMQRA